MSCARTALLLIALGLAGATGCDGCDGGDESHEGRIEPEPTPADDEPTTPGDAEDGSSPSPMFDELMESAREGPDATCDALEDRIEALSPRAVDDLVPTEPEQLAAPEQEAFVLEWQGRWIALPALPYRLMVGGGDPPIVMLRHDSAAFMLSRMVDEPIRFGDGEPRTHLEVLRAAVQVRRSDWRCDPEQLTASARRATLLMLKRGLLVEIGNHEITRAHSGIVQGGVTLLGVSDDEAHIEQALPAGGSEWTWRSLIKDGAAIGRVQRLLPALGTTERPDVAQAQPPAWLPDALAVAEDDAEAARRLLDADVPMWNEDSTRESLEQMATRAEP